MPRRGPTNQPGATPRGSKTAARRALKGRHKSRISSSLCRPFRAFLVGGDAVPGRCPGLICSAPSGQGLVRSGLPSHRRFPDCVDLFSLTKLGIQNCGLSVSKTFYAWWPIWAGVRLNLDFSVEAGIGCCCTPQHKVKLYLYGTFTAEGSTK